MELHQKITAVRDVLAALCAGLPLLGGALPVPVLTEAKGDLNAELTKALNSLGLSVVVIAPDARSVQTAPGTVLLEVRLVIEVSEQVLLNQAKSAAAGVPVRSALEVATAIVAAANRAPNGLDAEGAPHRAGLNEFRLAPEPLRLIPAARPTYHVELSTEVLLS